MTRRSLASSLADVHAWKHDREQAIDRARRLAAAVRERVWVLLEVTDPVEYATAYADSLDEGFHRGCPVVAVAHPNGEVEDSGRNFPARPPDDIL